MLLELEFVVDCYYGKLTLSIYSKLSKESEAIEKSLSGSINIEENYLFDSIKGKDEYLNKCRKASKADEPYFIKAFKDTPKKKSRCLSFVEEEQNYSLCKEHDIMAIIKSIKLDNEDENEKTPEAVPNVTLLPLFPYKPFFPFLNQLDNDKPEEAKDENLFSQVQSSDDDEGNCDMSSLENIKYIVHS